MRRAAPWAAAAAFFLAAFAWMDDDARVSREAFRPYSVHNRSPRGLSLAFRYLGADGSRTVSVLSRPMERAFLDPSAVLFRVHPDSPVPPGLQKPKKGG